MHFSIYISLLTDRNFYSLFFPLSTFYTFVSPLSSSEDTDNLQELPESITNMISLERSSKEMAFPAKI